MSRKQVVADCWYRGCAWLYLLAPLAWLYGLLSALRRFAYRRGWLSSTLLPVPVIVVGNITAGGTGKTPFVLWLVERLHQAGWHPGIVSRGYGGRVTGPAAVSPQADAGDYGDEPLLLARRAACPVWIGRRRAEAGQALLAAHPEVTVLIADDGLQHYALERAVEIVLIDGARGLGNGWRLPVGPLREARGRLKEVDAVVINGAALPRTEAQLGPIQPAWMHLHAGAIYNVRHPERCVDAAHFAGQSVHALAGIGHPARFFASLEAMGIDAQPLAFADHHDYTPGDLPEGTLLMTEKDAVKCAAFERDDMWALRVDAQVSDGLQTIILDKLKKTHGQQTA
jgi:tetraacyldisaccharide 4'-kinase